MMDAIIAVLGTFGRVSPRLRNKAELARIGRYYAIDSMLARHASGGQYIADATPETGQERLFDYSAKVIADTVQVERGDHAVF